MYNRKYFNLFYFLVHMFQQIIKVFTSCMTSCNFKLFSSNSVTVANFSFNKDSFSWAIFSLAEDSSTFSFSNCKKKKKT